MQFQQAMQQSLPTSFTQNGAISNTVADTSLVSEGRMGLFYKTVRGLSNEMLDIYLKKSISESLVETICLAFYIRDCRGGKGERDIGRHCFEFIANYSKECREKLIKVLDELPEYGRWDDLIWLSRVAAIRPHIVRLVQTQLEQDLRNMAEQRPVSLCAKWLPSEGYKLDKATNFNNSLLAQLKISPRVYRKKYLSPLRQYIDIVERKCCAGEWTNIDYSKVPSCAMHILSKAFKEHDAERFNEWKAGLESGKTKVNATQLFPYQIVEKYRQMRGETTPDSLYEAQWKEIVKHTSTLGTFNNSIVVCDVSGSMEYGSGSVKPIDVAISLGLLVAEVTQIPWKNQLITFHESPAFFAIKEHSSLLDKIQKVSRMPWDRNTDLQKVFDLILNVARANELTQSQLPERIYIISDMQFDVACRGNKTSNYNVIKTKYQKAGYTPPQLVFWNVNGAFNDYPIQVTDNNSIMISGFSQSILKYISEFSPLGIIRTLLDSDRYRRIAEKMA